jgi:hypothetical protein
MATNPRNPRYFPHMKVRGARRRRIAGIQRMTGAFDRLGNVTARAGEQFAAFVHTVTEEN